MGFVLVRQRTYVLKFGTVDKYTRIVWKTIMVKRNRACEPAFRVFWNQICFKSFTDMAYSQCKKVYDYYIIFSGKQNLSKTFLLLSPLSPQ